MRTIIVTGASDGIGAAAAEMLAGEDARLIVVGRSARKTAAVASRTGAESHIADFERLDEVRDLAAALRSSCERIDVLANNAGGVFTGPVRTDDGFEKTLQVNHLAPYLLTYLLLDRLLDGGGSVVSTSSIAARLFSRIDPRDLNGWERFRSGRAYGNAKLANVLFTKGLHERFHARGLAAVAFHPGMIATNFAAETGGSFHRMYHGALHRLLVSPQGGGANLAHFIAGTPGRDWTSGEFYGARRRVGRTHRLAYDPQVVRRHWELSAQMLDIPADWAAR